MRTLTFAAVLVATLLAPTAAGAADPSSEDWRANACRDPAPPGPPEQAAATGPSTLVASSRVPVDGLPGVQVGVDRLDFSGVICEVLYVDGALPRDAVVDVTSKSWCAAFDRTLDGKDEGKSDYCSGSVGSTRLYSPGVLHDAPTHVQVLSVSTFRGRHSEVLEAGAGVPPKYSGATFTSDHTGSSWKVALAGTTAVRREFDRSRVTDRAARAAYGRQVTRAARVFEERVAKIERTGRSRGWKAWQVQEARDVRKRSLALARKRQRLALEGIRLIVRDFRSNHRGTLPPAT